MHQLEPVGYFQKFILMSIIIFTKFSNSYYDEYDNDILKFINKFKINKE